MVAYDGAVMKAALQQAEAHMRGRVDEVNALNVFPIPDGDTGTNLHLTLQAMAKALSNIEDTSVAKVMGTAARAALLGARGNSGVILSQIIRGLAKGLETKETFSCSDFAQALAMATEQAYKTVLNPVEGTILTVIREASEAATLAAQRGNDLAELMLEMLARAKRTVECTPTLLPVLKDAGVVDAGGQGLYYFFEGMSRVLTGQDVSTSTYEQAAARLVTEQEYGWEVQLLLEGEDMGIDDLRDRLAGMGESVLVVGDNNLVRVHIHTAQPQEVLALCEARGRTADVSITNLDSQAEEFRAQR